MKVLLMDIVNTASIIHSVTLIMLLNEALADSDCQRSGGNCSMKEENCTGIIALEATCVNPDQSCCMPRQEPEIIPVKRSRKVNICYDCHHAVSRGRDVGNKACGEVFNNNEPTVKTINCTGHCMKEYLKLDDNNYSVKRTCDIHCDELDKYSEHRVYCCKEDLCNRGSTFQITYAVLILVLYKMFT